MIQCDECGGEMEIVEVHDGELAELLCPHCGYSALVSVAYEEVEGWGHDPEDFFDGKF